MDNALAEQLYTVEDKQQLEEGLDAVVSGLFNKNISVLESFEKNLAYNTISAIQKLAKAQKVSSSPRAVQSFVQDTKKQLAQLPVVKITVSFYPSLAALKRVSAKVERSLGKKMLLDIEVDPSQLGTIKVAYNGKVQIYSFAQLHT